MNEILHNGLTLTIVSVCVVFSSLAILYFVYTIIGKIVNKEIRRHPGEKTAVSDPDSPTDEEIAAMTAAIDMFIKEKNGDTDIHDIESGVITIKR